VLPLLLLACNTFGSAEAPVEQPTPSIPPVEPTSVPPTETVPVTMHPRPTGIPGWLTYHNATIGYSFDYPPEAMLSTTGVAGYPTEELPAGVEPGQYIATLEAAYSEGICASVALTSGTFVVWPAQENGGRYAGPCGVTGIGVYDIRTEEAPVRVDGQPLSLRTTRIYEVGTETLVNEFSTVRLGDGSLLSIISAWERNGKTYQDYLADRAILLQVLTTYRADH
jgi:hypothetical protein